MRGEDLSFLFPTRFPIRNTPTCVGKTCILKKGAARSWKHPHMRGEDSKPGHVPGFYRETPPHAWGRQDGTVFRVDGDRNTPTCVGKTIDGRAATRSMEKHPHMRGEDGRKPAINALRQETPPHAWGRLFSMRSVRREGRNTPTCVGKTSCSDIIERVDVETPPHAWGRRYLHAVGQLAERNTPTCVGKTHERLAIINSV